MTIVETTTGLNDEQLAAVEAEGSVFVSAGAGTGKTSVLVERYVRAVCERGIDVESILVITYTRKAAGELRSRIRAALRERGRPDLARELDGAWISTIHGFCNRLLRAHPFAAGLYPRFRELEDAGAAVLRGEAFERALRDSAPTATRNDSGCSRRTGPGLRRMLTGVYETLRSAGLELAPRARGAPERRSARCRAPCEAGSASPPTPRRRRRTAGTPARSSRVARLRRIAAERLVISRPSRAGERELRRSSGRARRPSGRLSRSWLPSIAISSQELLERFGAEYAAAKRRESVVDFEDLQLCGPRPASRRRRSPRRDAASLPDGHGRRVPGHESRSRPRADRPRSPPPGLTEIFTVGDEFQSIYGFRHADLEVFRERRRRRPPCSRSHRTTAHARRSLRP